MNQLSIDFSVPHVDPIMRFKRISPARINQLMINHELCASDESARYTKLLNEQFSARQKYLESFIPDYLLLEERNFDRANKIFSELNDNNSLSDDDICFLLEECWLPPGLAVCYMSEKQKSLFLST